MENYDVVIAGAGPAGLSLARELNNSGLSILVLDMKSSAEDLGYHTCGSFINLKEFGLPKSIANPIYKNTFSSENAYFEKKGIAYILDKGKLLAFLEREAKKNPRCKITYNLRIAKVNTGKEGVEHIVLGDGKKIKGRIYVDCTGYNRIISSKVGIRPIAQHIALGREYLVPLKKGEHVSELFVGKSLKGGYGWIFPLSKKRVIVGFGTLNKRLFPMVETYLRDMWKLKKVSERCQLKPLRRESGISATGIQTRLVRKNVACLGDSALQATPIVGEGVRPIMAASRLLALAIAESFATDDIRQLQSYERKWKSLYGSRYFNSAMLQRIIRGGSSHDFLMDMGTRWLGKLPSEKVIQLMSGDITSASLAKAILRKR